MKIDDIYKEWLSLQPLSTEQEDLLRNKFTTEYNYNSNHIEGNTLTCGQTEYRGLRNGTHRLGCYLLQYSPQLFLDGSGLHRG